MHKVQKEIVTASWICLLYLAAESIFCSVITPVKGSLLSDNIVLSQLFFLPQGVLIIITWLYRAKAMVYLLIAGFFTAMVTGRIPIDMLMASNIILISIIPYLVLELFKACGLDIYLMSGIEVKKQWRSIILVTFVCAIFNGISQGLISFMAGAIDSAIVLVSQEVIGGITGIIACLVCLYLYTKVVILYKLSKI